METLKIGEKTLRYDAERTRRVYSLSPRGSSWGCRCAGCRNFEVAAPAGFSPQFRSLLSSLGIDPRKEAFVRHLVPVSQGFSLYSGTYVFCGEISAAPTPQKTPSDIFEPCGENAWVTARSFDDPPVGWPNGESLRLEFLVVLPWLVPDQQKPLIDLGCSPC